MRVIFFLTLFLVVTSSYSQKTIEIDQDRIIELFYQNQTAPVAGSRLDSILPLPNKIVRIKGRNGTYTWKDTFEFQRVFINTVTKEELVFKIQLKEIAEIVTLDEVKQLKPVLVIDCPAVKIEWVEDQQYFEKALGCNREIEAKLSQIHSYGISDELYAFILQLPSGTYYNGMQDLIVDQPIREEAQKSKMYREIEAEFHKNEIDLSDPLEQPLVIIDNKRVYFEELNQLEEQEFLSSIVLKGAQATAIYGSNARNGVMILKTASRVN